MKVRIGAAVAIQLVVSIAFSSAAFAAGAAPKMTSDAQQQDRMTAGARHHQHRITRRPTDALHYYGRPVLYAPAPYAPFLPFITGGWER